jgi:hypothetical protein
MNEQQTNKSAQPSQDSTSNPGSGKRTDIDFSLVRQIFEIHGESPFMVRLNEPHRNLLEVEFDRD